MTKERKYILLDRTACIPVGSVRLDLPPEAPLHVGQGVAVGGEHLSEEGDVGDGQTQRVDLAEPLLVREGRHVHPKLVERRVYTAANQN